jgi:hypothetical protein
VLLVLLWSMHDAGGTLRAQTAPPRRAGIEVAAGPIFEVATAGDRASQRGVLVVPTLGVRVASWFEYTLEGHLSRHVTPVSGNVFGIVPVGFRLHTGTRTQVHLSAGAGIVWSDLAGLRGVEQRRNFITQIGVPGCHWKRDCSTSRTSTRHRRTSAWKGSPCWWAIASRVSSRGGATIMPHP